MVSHYCDECKTILTEENSPTWGFERRIMIDVLVIDRVDTNGKPINYRELNLCRSCALRNANDYALQEQTD